LKNYLEKGSSFSIHLEFSQVGSIQALLVCILWCNGI